MVDLDSEVEIICGEVVVKKWVIMKKFFFKIVDRLIELGYDSMEVLFFFFEDDFGEVNILIG